MFWKRLAFGESVPTTAHERFWVGTSLNHLVNSFQDTIHVLCGRISLLASDLCTSTLHATVMASRFVHVQEKLTAHFIQLHTEAFQFQAMVSNWLPNAVYLMNFRYSLKVGHKKTICFTRLPQRTAARRTPALQWGQEACSEKDWSPFIDVAHPHCEFFVCSWQGDWFQGTPRECAIMQMCLWCEIWYRK